MLNEEDITKCLAGKYSDIFRQIEKIDTDSVSPSKMSPTKIEKIKNTEVLTKENKEDFVSFAFHFKKTGSLLRIDITHIKNMVDIFNTCFPSRALPQIDLMRFMQKQSVQDGAIIHTYQQLITEYINQNKKDYFEPSSRRGAVVKGQMTDASLALSRFRAQNNFGVEME
jgi:hypothetical protein